MEKNWIVDGEFKKLTGEDIEKLTDEQLKEYHSDLEKERAEKEKELTDKITELENKADTSTEELEELKKELRLIDMEQFKSIAAAVKTQGNLLKEILEERTIVIDENNVRKSLRENKDKILSMMKGDVSSVTFRTKATIVNANVQNSTASLRINEIGKVPVRDLLISDLFAPGNFDEARSNGKITYVDQDTLNRNADNVAKCSPLPESDLTWIERECKVEKIGDTVKVCKDTMDDFDFIESEINIFLVENIQLKADENMLLGTGVTPQLKGIDSLAQLWSVGVGSPIEDLALSVQAPTIADVASTGIRQIIESGAGNRRFYNPNFILMNGVDVELMLLEKDLNNNSQNNRLVTISDDGTVRVKGIPVLDNPLVPADVMYIGDFRKGQLFRQKDLTIEIADQHSTDFVSDLLTIKGTWKAALVIRNVNANAFLKVTSISVAITALLKP